MSKLGTGPRLTHNAKASATWTSQAWTSFSCLLALSCRRRSPSPSRRTLTLLRARDGVPALRVSTQSLSPRSLTDGPPKIWAGVSSHSFHSRQSTHRVSPLISVPINGLFSGPRCWSFVQVQRNFMISLEKRVARCCRLHWAGLSPDHLLAPFIGVIGVVGKSERGGRGFRDAQQRESLRCYAGL